MCSLFVAQLPVNAPPPPTRHKCPHSLKSQPVQAGKGGNSPERIRVKYKSAPFSLYLSILFSRQSRTALTDGQARTPHMCPLLHRQVVTQQGSWLVMEPVSHPACTNLDPHPSVLHEAPPSSDQMAEGKRRGSGLAGGRGAANAGREPN